MSVDVFGRRREKKIENTRGPPGVGYKLTTGGEFDVENKRICNLGDGYNDKDAVNYKTLTKYAYDLTVPIKIEIEKLRSDIEDCAKILETYKSEIESELQKKVDFLSGLVEEHRDDIDQQFLKTNAKVNELKGGLDAIYIGHLSNG